MDEVFYEKFKDHLGAYRPVLFDSCCGEPVAWGHSVKYLPPDIAERFREHYYTTSLQNLDHTTFRPETVVITKKLSYTDAIEAYGEVTDIDRGPRGGFKSVTFGTKRFISKSLDPMKQVEAECVKTK